MTISLIWHQLDNQIRFKIFFSPEKPYEDSKAYRHNANILNSYQALTEQDENHFSANSEKDKQDISPEIKCPNSYVQQIWICPSDLGFCWLNNRHKHNL